jgi:deoxyribodipyrimidine photolyase
MPAKGGDACCKAMGKKWCASHFQCAACQTPISDPRVKFAEWDAKAVCIQCWGSIPLEVRKQVNKYASFEKKAREEEEKKMRSMERL